MAESHTDLSKVFSTLRDNTFSKTFPIDGKVFLLSLSGGADSVLLFYFLKYLKQNYSCEFKVIHFNHQLRGQESKEDELFCKKLCESNNINLQVFQLNFDLVTNLQDDARNARYSILKDQLSDDDCYLLTAHHGSDSIESMLIGFHQGRLDSRILNLQVVQLNHKIIRPLVNLNKETILELLHVNDIKYRNDSSNKNIKYLRNYYRHSSLMEISTELSNIQDYLSKAQKEKQRLFQSIPYTVENEKTVITKTDLFHFNYLLKVEFFYFLHQNLYADFMKKLDMKRVELLLSSNRFGKKYFLVSSFHQKKLSIIEYSKKYEIVIE